MSRLLIAILRTDLRRVVRDRFMLGLVGMALGFAVAVRFALPAIAGKVQSFDLEVYFPLFVSYVVISVAALMAGAVGGFLLLESREEATVRAIAVTPVPLQTYLAVMGGALAVFTTFLALGQSVVIGLALPPCPTILGCALCGAGFAPAIAFFLAAFSSNKVEAFAVMKILGVVNMIPLGAWFLPEPLQWLCGFFPPYLVCKAWWTAEAGGSSWPLWLFASLPVTLLYLWLLGKRFLHVATR